MQSMHEYMDSPLPFSGTDTTLSISVFLGFVQL